MKVIYDAFDKMIADFLKVPVDEYIRKIESIDEDQRDSIIFRLLSSDEKIMEEGKLMFEDIDA